jgi:DNA-binding response OmpR family regulator
MTLVALTGWGQEEDRRRSYEAGFDSHMTKPVDLPALKQLLTAICDRAAENAASGNDAKRPNTSNAPRPA